MEHALAGKFFEDEVYSKGRVVRIERSPSQLGTELEGYCNDTTDLLWWGITEPYTNYPNKTISYYTKGTAPFGDNDWYGVKTDTVTGETWYKVQVNSYFLEENTQFDAKAETYTSSGDLIGYDYYIHNWTPEQAEAYCAQHGLVYAFSPLNKNCEGTVWIWGITCSLDNTPVCLKAYRIKR
ncbi:MAG: hypothetical protein P8I94_04145 [Emcibacteraceae bacterium]|nr:hypothetical protein [Emcibacteraceae bacterium]